MSEPLSIQTAVITGASRGIGRAIAEALGKQKMRLVLLARSKDKLEEVATRVNELGGEGIVEECDFSNQESLQDAILSIKNKINKIDIFISNAGAFLEKPLTDISLQEWERVMRINLTAPFLLYKEMMLIMKNQKSGGKIITIASSSSLKGYVNQSVYSASKHGLLGLTRCLAIEGKPHNIHVNTICPGGVKTDFIKGSYCEKRVSKGPMIEPEDVAKLVLFLIQQKENVDIPEVVLNRFAPQ
jgi:3-oxoacyl-[acyl-carrier protein] reductase